MDDDQGPTCPLCIAVLDETERGWVPCPCGYQICLFCYERIRNEFSNQCPGCRTPYDPNFKGKVRPREPVVTVPRPATGRKTVVQLRAPTQPAPRRVAGETAAYTQGVPRAVPGTAGAAIGDQRIAESTVATARDPPPPLHFRALLGPDEEPVLGVCRLAAAPVAADASAMAVLRILQHELATGSCTLEHAVETMLVHLERVEAAMARMERTEAALAAAEAGPDAASAVPADPTPPMAPWPAAQPAGEAPAPSFAAALQGVPERVPTLSQATSTWVQLGHPGRRRPGLADQLHQSTVDVWQ